MSSLWSFVSANKVELLGALYFLCLVGSHAPGMLGGVCKWLVSGKLVQPPQA